MINKKIWVTLISLNPLRHTTEQLQEEQVNYTS